MMKIIIVLAASFILASCGKEYYSREYKIADDGLIYKSGSKELYTGIVSDTSDIVITFEVVDGVKNGAFITYYPDGKYEKYGLIENNNNVGEWNYFYPNGQLESTGSFENNKPSGRWVSYYPNGNIKTLGEYLEGEQHGLWKYYNSKGELTNMLSFWIGMISNSHIKT